MREAAGYLVFRDLPRRQFLLLDHGDRWDLPKGHVDLGESIREAAVRELFEETGISAAEIHHDDDFQFDIEYSLPSTRGEMPFAKHVTIFLAWLQRDVQIQLTEHQAYQWFDWNPPHRIQQQTIDPLLDSAARYFSESGLR